MEHHHHGAGGCEHSHDGDPAVAYSLYQKIDMIHMQCFNESEEGAGKKVFKPWEERLDKTEVSFISHMFICASVYACTIASLFAVTNHVCTVCRE